MVRAVGSISDGGGPRDTHSTLAPWRVDGRAVVLDQRRSAGEVLECGVMAGVVRCHEGYRLGRKVEGYPARERMEVVGHQLTQV